MTFSPYPAISLLGPQPPDQNLLAWTFDPADASATIALTAGQSLLGSVSIRTQRVVNNILVYVYTAGVTLTAGQNFAGLVDSSGNLVGESADQSTAWTSIGLKTMALTTPVSAGPGTYWIALLANGTTPPTILRSGSGSAVINAGLTAATARAATDGTGLTSLANFSPSAIAPSTNLMWAALS